MFRAPIAKVQDRQNMRLEKKKKTEEKLYLILSVNHPHFQQELTHACLVD